MGAGASEVYLHIGRGKAGSSTVQSLADTHGAYMQSIGVFCPLTLHGLSNNARLASALERPGTDRPTIKKFRKDLVRSPSPKMLVSAEAFHGLTSEGLARLKRLLGDRQVHILFYVRDYPGWLPSRYAQGTKKATNLDDFDRYLERNRDGIPVVARLENWAQVFGWPSMHVRPLDTANLFGGDLVADVFRAMGIEAPAPPVSRQNESPHWMTLEVMRELAIRLAPDRAPDSRSVRAIRRVIEEAVAMEPRRTPYLTRSQWQWLADLYRADIDRLGGYMGRTFPLALAAPEGERQFLPSFGAISREIRDGIRARLAGSPHTQRIDPGIASVLDGMLAHG